MEPIAYLAGAVGETTLSSNALREARYSLLAHAGGGLLVLLMATTMAVYKPRGMTRYGARRQDGQLALPAPQAQSFHSASRSIEPTS